MFLNVSEVERQLNRGAPTPQLPNKKQRTGSSSSGASKKVDVIDEAAKTPTMLSTFGSGASKNSSLQQQQHQPEVLTAGPQGLLSTKSTVVQLRRSTNTKGKQAPTPPKRTR